MIPSMIACATWMPFGANSLAIDVDNARNANLELAKDDMSALAFTDAVAPVKMSVGGCFALLSSPCLSRSGSEDCEKRKAPLLEGSSARSCIY